MKLLKAFLLSTAPVLALASGGAASAQQLASTAEAGAEAQTAAADTTVGTVIVTARQIRENIQEVPATVTAISGEDLRTQNIVTIMDLTTVTPSLVIGTFDTSLLATYSLRGLPTGVTQYFAEAPCCAGTANTPFLDTASVQVLDGPQGTLFGRSSAAGAILIEPEHPKLNEYAGSVDVTVGDYDRAQFTGVVNIPLISDHLAARFAFASNSVAGYTSLFNSTEKLDGINNQQYQLGFQLKLGSFQNYLVARYLNVDESGYSEILDAANPNYSLYVLPQAFAPFVFGAVCAQAVSLGLTSSTVGACETQRVDTLHSIGAALQAELSRVAGGGSAVRSTAPSYDGSPQFNLEHHGSLVDVAQYDFGDGGPVAVNLKNIFSYDVVASDAGINVDGIGGQAEIGAVGEYAANNESGNRITTALSPGIATYTEEFQVHGDVNNGLVKPTLGVFYSNASQSAVPAGTINVYKLFSGVLTPNLGFQNADNFVDSNVITESAWYAQATVDLSKVGVHGLSLTGGYRQSWDKSVYTSSPPVINYATGAYSPGPTPSTTVSTTAGYNFTASAAEQWRDDLMTYVTVSRAYIPGGVNTQGQSAVGLPGYTPTYASEIVLDEEIGVKADFAIGQMKGRLDADFYHTDFTNIAVELNGLIGTTSVAYTENAAAAEMHGIEVSGALIPDPSWKITFGYSYDAARYTKWVGADPLNKAVLGPGCAPQSPAGVCWINLANNPFPFMPANQGHVTIAYQLPLAETLGNLSISATVYAQDTEYFSQTFARDLALNSQAVVADSQAPYATLNLRFDWRNFRGSGWDAAVFVNNATNALYATFKQDQVVALGYGTANYAAPTMFGFELSKKFD